jgi:hypothetical protein
MTVQVALEPGGADWATHTTTSAIDFSGMSAPSVTKGVTGPAGLYWIAPEALAGARVGTVVDEDPVTTGRTVVTAVEPGPAGTEVTFETTLPGISITTTYGAASGVLVGYRQSMQSSGITADLRLDRLP